MRNLSCLAIVHSISWHCRSGCAVTGRSQRHSVHPPDCSSGWIFYSGETFQKGSVYFKYDVHRLSIDYMPILLPNLKCQATGFKTWWMKDVVTMSRWPFPPSLVLSACKGRDERAWNLSWTAKQKWKRTGGSYIISSIKTKLSSPISQDIPRKQ